MAETRDDYSRIRTGHSSQSRTGLSFKCKMAEKTLEFVLVFSSFSVKMNGFKNNLKSAGKSTTANSTSDMTLMEWSKWISNIFFYYYFS